MTPLHILFLSDNFPPEINAPASRTHEHCRMWVRAGHKVTVITCAPNFPKGRVFDGYRNRLWQSETVDGIRVIRVWSYITRNEGFAKRILDYLSYMVMAFLAALFVRRVDIVIGTSPQFFTAVAAWGVGLFKRRPWIFELRDIWPESIRAVDAMKPSRALDWMERFELFLYRRASAVVAVTHRFKDNLVGRGINATKIHVVTNGVDLSRFAPTPKDSELVEALALKDRFVVGYVGTHGMAHSLDTLLDAAAIVAQRGDGGAVRFVLLGDGAERARLVARAADMRLGNVRFLESVGKDRIARYWSLLDVSVIHLRRTPIFQTVIPSKLFECMGMGLPVLHGVEGESAEIVERHGVGLVFEPENAAALADAILRLRDDRALHGALATRGPQAAAAYDRNALADAMMGVVVATANDRKR